MEHVYLMPYVTKAKEVCSFPLADLPLQHFTLVALAKAGMKTAGDILPFRAYLKLPKGIGEGRLAEVRKAIEIKFGVPAQQIFVLKDELIAELACIFAMEDAHRQGRTVTFTFSLAPSIPKDINYFCKRLVETAGSDDLWFSLGSHEDCILPGTVYDSARVPVLDLQRAVTMHCGKNLPTVHWIGEMRICRERVMEKMPYSSFTTDFALDFTTGKLTAKFDPVGVKTVEAGT